MNQLNQNPNQDFLKQRVNSFLARRNTENQMDQSRNTQEEFQVTVNQMLEQDQFKIQVQEEQIYGQIKQKHKNPEKTANQYQNESQAIKINNQEDFKNKNLLSIPRGEFSYLTSASCLSIGDENIQQKQLPFQDHVKKSNQEKFDQCQTYNKFNGRSDRNEDLIIFTEEVTNEMNRTNATNMSIEDRLIQEGIKMKFQKERRIKDYENYLKQQSNPKINQFQGSSQSDQDKNNEEKQILNENVTERLFSYHQFYKEKKKLKKEIFEMENMPSFTPKINRGPKTTSNLQKESSKKSGFYQDLTFQPQIDKNSEKIAERLGKFEERLINRKSSTPEFQTFSYQPQINKKSAKLTTREGDVFSNLYEKNKEQQKKIEESKKIIEQSKKDQIDQECTFVPSLNKNSKYYKVGKEDINERMQS